MSELNDQSIHDHKQLQKIEVKLRDKKRLSSRNSGDQRPIGLVQSEYEDDFNLEEEEGNHQESTQVEDFAARHLKASADEYSEENQDKFEDQSLECSNPNPNLDQSIKKQVKSDSLDSNQAQACCTKLAFNIYNKALEGAKKHLPKNKPKNRYSGAFPRSFGEDFHSLGPEGFYYLDDAQTECSLDYRDIELNRDSYLFNGSELLPELSEDEFYQNKPKIQNRAESKSAKPEMVEKDSNHSKRHMLEMEPPSIPENTPLGSVENLQSDSDLKSKRKSPSLFERLFRRNKSKHGVDDGGDGKSSSKARSEPREVERAKNFRAQSLPPGSASKQPLPPPPSFKISEDGKLWFEHKTIPPPLNPDEAYLSNVTRQSPIKLVYGKPPEIIVQEVTNLSEAVDTLPRSSTPASIDDVAEKTMIDILDDAIRQLREENNIPIFDNPNTPAEPSLMKDELKANPKKRKPNSLRLKKPKFLKKFEKKPISDEVSDQIETEIGQSNLELSPTTSPPAITIEEVRDPIPEITLDFGSNTSQMDEGDTDAPSTSKPHRFAMKKPKIFDKKLPRPQSFVPKWKMRDKNKTPHMKKPNGSIPSWKDASKKLFAPKRQVSNENQDQQVVDSTGETRSTDISAPKCPKKGSLADRRANMEKTSDPMAIEIEIGVPLSASLEDFEEKSKPWTKSPFHRFPEQDVHLLQQSPQSPSVDVESENLLKKSDPISIKTPEIIVLPGTPDVDPMESDLTPRYQYKPPEIIVKIPLNAKSDYDQESFPIVDVVLPPSPPLSPKNANISRSQSNISDITIPEPEFVLPPVVQQIENVYLKQDIVFPPYKPKSQFEQIENIREIGVTYEPPPPILDDLMYGEEPSDGIVKPMKEKVERLRNMAGSFGQSFKTKMKDLIHKKPANVQPKVIDVTMKTNDPSETWKETNLDDLTVNDQPMLDNNHNNDQEFSHYDPDQPLPVPTKAWDVLGGYHVDTTVDDEEPPDPVQKEKKKSKFRLKMPHLSSGEPTPAKQPEQDSNKRPIFNQKNRERLQQIQYQAKKSFGQISDRFKQHKQTIQERTRSFKSKSPTPPPRPPAPYRQSYDTYNYDLHFASDSELSPGTGVDSLRRSKVFQELADAHQRLELYMSPVDRHEPRRPPRKKSSGAIRDDNKMFNRSMPSLGMRPAKPPRPPPPRTKELMATSCQSVPLQISVIPCEDEIPLGTSTSSIWTEGKPRQRFPRQQRVPAEMFYRNVRLGYRPKKTYVELLQKSQPFYTLVNQKSIERSQSTGQLYGRHTSPPAKAMKKGRLPVAPLRKTRTMYVKTKFDPNQNFMGLGSKPPISPFSTSSRATSVASSRRFNDYNPYATDDEYAPPTNFDSMLFEQFESRNVQPCYRLQPQPAMKSVCDLNWEPFTWKIKRCRSSTELEVRELLKRRQLQTQQPKLDEEPSTPDSTDTIVAPTNQIKAHTLRSERAQSTQPIRSNRRVFNETPSMPKRIFQWLSSTKSLDNWKNRNNSGSRAKSPPPPRPPLPPPRMGIHRATSPTLTTNTSSNSNSMFYVSDNPASVFCSPNTADHNGNYYYYNNNVDDNFFLDELRENGNKTPTNRPLPPPPVPPRPRLIPAHYGQHLRPETRDVACDTSENGFLKFCAEQNNNHPKIPQRSSQSVNTKKIDESRNDRDRKSNSVDTSTDNDDEPTLIGDGHQHSILLNNGRPENQQNDLDNATNTTSVTSVYTDARSHQTNTFSNQNRKQSNNNNLIHHQWSSDEDTINDDLSSLSSSNYQSVLESPTGTLLYQQQPPPQPQPTKNESFLHRYSSNYHQAPIATIMSSTTTSTQATAGAGDNSKSNNNTANDDYDKLVASHQKTPSQPISTTADDEMVMQQKYSSQSSSIVSESQQFVDVDDLDRYLILRNTGGDDNDVEDDGDGNRDKNIMDPSTEIAIKQQQQQQQQFDDQTMININKDRQSCISTESSESTTSSTSTSSTISSSVSYSLESNKNSYLFPNHQTNYDVGGGGQKIVNDETLIPTFASLTSAEIPTTSNLDNNINKNNNNKKKKPNKKFSLTEPPWEISRPRTNTDATITGSPINNPSLRENLSSLPKSTPNGSKPDKRYYCAHEFYTTERDYVDVLVMLTEEFKQAIHQYVTPKWLETFFKPLDLVTPINQKLLEELKKRVLQEWDENPKLSDLIIQICPYFKEYSIYIREFDRINLMLDDASQRFENFEKILKEFENGDRCRKLTIKSYLLKPIQRLPQYRLMLAQYSKSLNENDEEFEATQKAMKIVSDVVEHIERESLMAERSHSLNELRNCIITTKPNIKIVTPGRVIIRRGQLDKVSRKEVHVRYFILFNDVLFYLTPVMNGMYKLKEELPLLGMQVEMSPNFNQEFIVRSVKRSFALLTKDTQEREEWVRDLRAAIADHTEKLQSFDKSRHSNASSQDLQHSISNVSNPSSPQSTLGRPSNHKRASSILSTESGEHGSETQFQSAFTPSKLGDLAPVWLHDNRVTFCYSCKSQFTFLNRRHHCRACGQIFCAVCSSHQYALKYLDYKTDRVCDECYEILSSQDSQSASNSPPTQRLSSLDGVCDVEPHPETQDMDNRLSLEETDINLDDGGGRKSPPKIMVSHSPPNSIKNADSLLQKNHSNSFHDLRHNQVKITSMDNGDKQQQPQHITLMRNKDIRSSSRLAKNKHVSSVLVEVSANDPSALISGWLQRYFQKKGWKRYWFVIKNMVLYTFKASEDVRALETNPLPGYEVSVSDESIKGYPADLIIRLSHKCQSTIYFFAETPEEFKRWFECFKESALLGMAKTSPLGQ